MSQQQYQQQYVTSLLGDQDPTDYHSKLWEWYEKYDKPGREKRLAQDAANEQRRVQIAKEQGLVPLIDKLSKAGLAGLKLKKVLDKQAKKTEVKEKGKFWQNWEAMDRSKSDVDYDLIEQNIFKTASDEYDGDFKRLWKDETRLRELTAGLPQEIREKYLKLSPSEIVWAREYQGLRLLDTLTQDQFHSELTEAGDYQEYLKSDNKSQQYKAWMLNKLDPFEFSDGQLSKVLYKGLNRLSSTANGRNKTTSKGVRLSENTLKFVEQMSAFNSTDANSDVNSSGALRFSQKLTEDGIDLINSELAEINKKKLDQLNATRKSDGLAPLKILPEDQLVTKLENGKLSNGLTPQKQALLNLAPTLNAAFRSRKLNLPEFMSRRITGHDDKETTIQELFFSDEEGKKIYNTAVQHWESGSAEAVAQREAVAQQNLVKGLDKCQQGLCTLEDIQQYSFDWIRSGGSTDNKYYKALQSLNWGSLTGKGLTAETKRVDHALSSGSFMSERNISNFSKIANGDLNKRINGIIEKTKRSQAINQFPTYKDRLRTNKLGLNLNSNRDVLRNESTGDKRSDRLAAEITQLEEILYQKYLNAPNGETDFDIGRKVTTEIERIKEANGYYKNIDDDGAGIWSKDQFGHRTNYYKSLAVSDFNVNKALGEKPTLNNIIRWDNNFHFIKQTVNNRSAGKPGQTYVNQISNTPGLLSVDSFIAGTSGNTKDGFTSTAEASYYSASLRNIGERLLLSRQGHLLLKDAETNPELKELVKNYDIKGRLKKLDAGLKVEKNLVEAVQKTGDQYLQTIVGLDPKRFTKKNWERFRQATPSSNRTEVTLDSTSNIPAGFPSDDQLDTIRRESSMSNLPQNYALEELKLNYKDKYPNKSDDEILAMIVAELNKRKQVPTN